MNGVSVASNPYLHLGERPAVPKGERRTIPVSAPPLDLPADRPRLREPGRRRERREVIFRDGELVDTAVLLAAVAVAAARTTGRRDLVLGTPVPAAPDGDGSGLGAVRVDLHDDPTFGALVDRIRLEMEVAAAEGPIPWNETARRSTAYRPVVQVAAVVHTGKERRELLPVPPEIPPLDLLFELDRSRNPARLAVDLDADRFGSAGPVHLEVLRTVLAAALVDPALRISTLPLVSGKALDEVVRRWAVVERPYPRESGIAEQFALQAARRPDTVAVVDPGRDGVPGGSITYGELGRRADLLAHRLARAGVGRGTPVAIALDRSVELLVAMLAVLRAGGAYVPVDPGYPRERLAFLVADAAAPVVLTRSDLSERLPIDESGGPTRILRVEPGAMGTVEAPPDVGTAFPTVGADDLAYITYTSGSTGRPKGVAVRQRGVVRLVKETDYARLGPDDTFLYLAAVTFDATTLEVWAPLLNGGRLVLFTDDRPTPDRLAEVAAAERITFLWLTAGLFHQMVEARPDGLAPVPHVLAGGDVLSAAACRKLLALHPGMVLTDGYGPTENTTFSTCHRMASPEEVRDPVSIGRPVANSEAFVLGEALEPLPALVPGELCLGGDGVALGYWRRPGLSAERFVPHPFSLAPGARIYRSGDLARWLPDATVEFLGRRDHQVKLRGFRIELPEIESVLAAHPGVAEVVATVRDAAGPDGVIDRTLVVHFVPAGPGGAPAPTPRELREHASRSLPDAMVPTAYVALSELPLSPNGKVDRNALPAPGPEHRARAEEHVAPRTPEEKALAAIWTEVLGVPRVGLTDDFFQLGGHSLLAAGVVGRVASALEVELPVAELFRARTLGALAREVERRRTGGPEATGARLPPIRRRPPEGRPRAPLSAQQRGLWLVDRLRPGRTVYNLPVRFRLRGALRPGALARSLAEVVRRHEALRARFVATGDGLAEQRFLPPSERAVRLPVVDLSGLPGGRAEAAADGALEREIRRPFELAKDADATEPAGAPLRMLLIRSGPLDHRLLFHPHHIVFDGWSVELLASELRALYPGLATDPPALEPRPLPALPIEYGDYASWQAEVYTEERLAPEIAHWRRHLEGLPQLLELPTDRPRPRALGDRGGEVGVEIDSGLREGVEALAREEGATLFMAILASLTVVLARWSGRDEIAIGSMVAGRQRPELESLLGYFVNTVVLRCDLAGEPTFRALLGRCRDETARALSHALLPFDRLVAELGQERDDSYHPVIQVLVSGQDLDRVDGELAPGLTLEAEPGGNGTAKLDLGLFIDRRRGGVGLRFEYSTELFDRETVRRLGAQTIELLRQAAARPNAPVSTLELLPAAERRWLLDEWRIQRSGYPREAGLVELFDRQVAARPDAVAVAGPGRHGHEQVSYRELDRRARVLARRIAGASGTFARGTSVGLALERSVDQVVTILAAIRAGGAYVPLDAGYPRDRLTFLAEDAGVRVLVSESGVLERMPFLAEREDLAVVRLDDPPGEMAPEPGRTVEIATGAEDAAYLCYTSGSTGLPKGAVVPQRGVARLVLEADYARFAPDETFLLLAPVSFDLTTLELWGPLLTGGRLALHPPERPTPEGLSALLARERVTTLWLTAGLFHQVVEDAPEALAPLRLLMAGGDVLSPELCRVVLRTHSDLVLVDGYGPTENTTFTSCHRMTSPEDVLAPVPIGLPIHDTSVAVVDPRLRLQPVGVPGELVTGGDGVAWGYWNRPALTAERFVPDPFSGTRGEAGARLYRTGDLARWLPTGILEFLGRNDGQVKLRGFRIELGEVESALASHPRVHRAVVVARKVGGGSERVLVGYAVPDGDPEPTEAELRAWLETRLPPYMVPGALVVLRELPLDPNGKVARKALPDPAEERDAGVSRVAPRSATERAVAAIWTEVLGVDGLALEDDFFRLGGHSLLAARVISRLRAHLGVETTLARIFALRTLGAFAHEIETQRGAADTDSAPASSPASAIRRSARRRLVRRAPRGREEGT